jgi:hypothetical protein
MLMSRFPNDCVSTRLSVYVSIVNAGLGIAQGPGASEEEISQRLHPSRRFA